MKRFITIAAVAAAIFSFGGAVTPAVADAATTCSNWAQHDNGTWIYWCTNQSPTGWTVVDYYYWDWDAYDAFHYQVCYWRTGSINAPTCFSV